MGRIRLGARRVVATGMAVITAGVWDRAGRPAALIAGGLLTVVFGLVFMDVE